MYTIRKSEKGKIMPLLSRKEVLNLKLSSIPSSQLRIFASILGILDKGPVPKIIKKILEEPIDEKIIDEFIRQKYREKTQKRTTRVKSPQWLIKRKHKHED